MGAGSTPGGGRSPCPVWVIRILTGLRANPPKTLAKSLAGDIARVIVATPWVAFADFSCPLYASCAQLSVGFVKISRFHLEAMVLVGLALLLAEKHAYATLWERCRNFTRSALSTKLIKSMIRQNVVPRSG